MSFWILVLLVSNLAKVSAECDSAMEAPDVGCLARRGRSLMQTKRVQVPSFRVASDNGKKFECDTTKLSTRMCYFVATADNDIGGAYPHHIDSCSTGNNRKVVDSSGVDLPVTPKPWQTGDTLAESETEVTGDLLMYAKAFEMMAPLRDLMMYEPEALKEDKELWDFVTQPLKDCGIKDVDEQGDHGTALSRDNVYEKLKDNGGKDSHHNILQFLEEGVIDLVCTMTSEASLTDFSRCQTVRERSSTCWESAYAMQQAECLATPEPAPEPPVPEPTPEVPEPAPEPAPEPPVPQPTPEAPAPEPTPEPFTTRPPPTPEATPAPAPPPPAPKPARRPRPVRPPPKRRR